MLPSGDSYVMKDVTLHYCQVSLATYSSSLILLYFSGYYLKAGKRDYLRILAVFVAIDILKWLYHKISVERDLRQTYKKKPLSFFALVTKCFDLLHLLKSIIVVGLGSIGYHFLAILFGADIFSKFEETYMFALLMSTLTVFPLCLNFGVSTFPHLLSGLKPWNSLHQLLSRSLHCTVLGAWSGAAVIPLDWGRPWQLWPIPCSFGALAMCSLSYLVMYCHIHIVNSNFSLLKKIKFC